MVDAAWAAAAAAAAGSSFSSGSNVVGTPRGGLGLRASPYDSLGALQVGGLDGQALGRLPQGFPLHTGWVNPVYGHVPAAAAEAAVAAWGMPAVRAASAGDLQLLAHGGVGQLQPMATAGGAAAGPYLPSPWRPPAMDLQGAVGLGMGLQRQGGRLMAGAGSVGAGGGPRGGRRFRSNSYSYGGYGDFCTSMYQWVGGGAGAWADPLSAYGSFLVSPASTVDSASTGSTPAWLPQLPPPPVSTPRHMLSQWQLQQHQQQLQQQQQQVYWPPAFAADPVSSAAAAAAAAGAGSSGSNSARRRRHSVCMGDPRLQLQHQRRRYSSLRSYGPLVLEMQPWAEVEEGKYASQELDLSKQQLQLGPTAGAGVGGSGAVSQGASAAAAVGGGPLSSSQRTSRSGSLLLSPTGVGLTVPVSSPAGPHSSIMRIGSGLSISPAGATSSRRAEATAATGAAAAAAAAVGDGGVGVPCGLTQDQAALLAAVGTHSCPCNVVGLEPGSASTQGPAIDAAAAGVGAGAGAAATAAAGAVTNGAAEPASPAAPGDDTAAVGELASESGVATLL